MFTKDNDKGEGEIPSSPGEMLIDVKQTEDKLILTHAYDVTPILADCYEMRKGTKQSWSKGRSNYLGRHVGRVPVAMLNDWVKNGLVHCDPVTGHLDMRGVFAMLNKNPDFKTTRKTL